MEVQLVICLVLLVVGSILAFAPDAWLTMMARAFMLQWALLFAALSILVLFRRTRVIGFCAAACLLMSASQLRPFRQPEVPVNSGNADLKILHMNVLQPNDRFSSIIARANDSDADVISVQEVDQRWAVALSQGLKDYPFRVIEPRSNCYGIALFSRFPLIDPRVIELQGTPVIGSTIMIDGDPIRLVSAHATSPISYGHFRKRNGQLIALADLVDDPTPTIVVGDLNTVQWDNAFRRFCSRSGLRPVNKGKLRTWPAIGPFALIPIDHVFLSKDLSCSRIERIGLPGSDHFGLIAEIDVNDAR